MHMNRRQLVCTICVLGIGFLFVGCGGDDGNTPSGPPTVNVTGRWTGSSTDAYGSVRWKSSVIFNLSQQASGAVTGTVKASTEEPASGLVANDHLTLTVDYGNGISGTFNLDVAGDSMSGTYADDQWTNGQHKDVVVQRVSL